MKPGAGIDRIKDRLVALQTGTRIRTKKCEDLCDIVSKAADPHATWTEIVAELETLVDYSGGEQTSRSLRNVPVLTQRGFTAGELEETGPRLTPEEWLNLSLTELQDVPVFEYRQTAGQYIQFSDASAGQQATALLRVLLNQTGPPLLIDQPEEDLDNQVILEIVQEIWKAKKKRQILFSSHNPTSSSTATRTCLSAATTERPAMIPAAYRASPGRSTSTRSRGRSRWSWRGDGMLFASEKRSMASDPNPPPYHGWPGDPQKMPFAFARGGKWGKICVTSVSDAFSDSQPPVARCTAVPSPGPTPPARQRLFRPSRNASRCPGCSGPLLASALFENGSRGRRPSP